MDFNFLEMHKYLTSNYNDITTIRAKISWWEFPFIIIIFSLILIFALGAELSDGPFIIIQVFFFAFFLFISLYLLFIKVNKRIIIHSDSIELRLPWLFGPDKYIIPFTDIKSLELKNGKNRKNTYFLLIKVKKKKKRPLFVFTLTKPTDMISLQEFIKELAMYLNVDDLKLPSLD